MKAPTTPDDAPQQGDYKDVDVSKGDADHPQQAGDSAGTDMRVPSEAETDDLQGHGSDNDDASEAPWEADYQPASSEEEGGHDPTWDPGMGQFQVSSTDRSKARQQASVLPVNTSGGQDLICNHCISERLISGRASNQRSARIR